MKEYVTKLMKSLMAIMMIILISGCSMTSCRNDSEAKNKEETSEPDNTKENGEDKEEETESKVLESEGDIEIILDEDEETFGE